MHTHEQTLLTSLRLEAGGVPIYVQLRDQLLRAIGAGTLAPGARMPTMRQVSVSLRIDLNTVRHAYEELERLGAVILARGRGTFVASRPPAADRAARERDLEVLARQAIALASAAGLDPRALAERMILIVQQKETFP